MDLINDGILWKFIMDSLAKYPHEITSPITGVDIWSDGDQIMTDDGKTADAIADFLEALGYETHVGYYDPAEDERDGLVDDHTGYWYIDID